MEKELPKGWEETTLGEISEWSSGGTPKRGVLQYYGGSIPWIKTGDLNGGIVNDVKEFLTEEGIFKSSAKVFPKGSVGIAMYGATIGKTGVLGMDAATNQACAVAMPYLNMNDFLHLFLKSEKQNFIDKGKGGAQPNISQTVIKAHKINLPPLAEQKRIVAKLDTLFASLEKTKTRLDRIPELLKNFKQAVLTQAVTGKLTEQWRDGKVLEEWEEKQLGDILPKGGIFDGPFGSKLKTEHYTNKGVQVIRLENINHLSFDSNKQIFISDERYQTLLRHTVKKGDIIFASFISEEIRACILPQLKTNAIAKADCFCIRPSYDIVKPKYLLFSLIARKSYHKLINNIHGSTRPRINTTQLKQLEISVPSLVEQSEIVRRVESLFAKADAIEGQYNKLKQKIDTLPQAILAKAFKGELVAQNPLDEPASVLLEKIKALREAEVKVKPKRKTVRKKKA